jgi:hypothetical protein
MDEEVLHDVNHDNLNASSPASSNEILSKPSMALVFNFTHYQDTFLGQGKSSKWKLDVKK